MWQIAGQCIIIDGRIGERAIGQQVTITIAISVPFRIASVSIAIGWITFRIAITITITISVFWVSKLVVSIDQWQSEVCCY